MKLYTNFFKTADNEQIHYTTNFKVDEKSEYHDVIVFNYGLVCSTHHWSKQLDFFNNNGIKFLLHDYRGHYLSSGAESLKQITFEQIAIDTINLCEHLKITSIHTLGHSMGVNICLEMAKRKTELVKSMILISGTVMPVNDVMFHTNIMEHLKPILHYGLSKYPKFYKQFWKLSGWNPLAKKLVHLGGFNTKEVPMEFIEIYLNRLGQLGPELFFHLLDEMSRHDIITHLSKITQPTLIVGGDNDKVIPNYLQKGLGQMILNSQIYIVKNGSHVPQVDFPELVNERMNYFLQTNLI